jgi:hypothetical protein
MMRIRPVNRIAVIEKDTTGDLLTKNVGLTIINPLSILIAYCR